MDDHRNVASNAAATVVTQLTKGVISPAASCSVGQQRTRMIPPRSEGHDVVEQNACAANDNDRSNPGIRGRVIADLTRTITTPALRGAVGQQCAVMTGSSADGDSIREPAHGHGN